MTVRHHPDVIQGSDEWLAMRRGIITASEMKLLLTPTLKTANNEKTRAHIWELAAQRISNYVEPHYISDDMLRGQEDEITARFLYNKHVAPVVEVGFITNDRWGFTMGYSPDGLVGTDGLVECKSRRQKFQIETIVEWWRGAVVPIDFILQCQTGLLVSERKWIDLVSYSGGLPMLPMRIYPDDEICAAIEMAAQETEARIAAATADYAEAVAAMELIETERREEEEIVI